jgi:hypothetical protein
VVLAKLVALVLVSSTTVAAAAATTPHAHQLQQQQQQQQQCATTRGVSWPHNSGASLPHLSNVTDQAGCCAACGQRPGCATWTLHPASGCWLHGPTQKPPRSQPCGDRSACVTGARPGGTLPPVSPPPSPRPPAPPRPAPHRPPPRTLARPSPAHLRFHDDNLGAISHFSMQTYAPKGQRHIQGFVESFPPSKFSPSLLDTDQWVGAAASFGAKYYVLVPQPSAMHPPAAMMGG